MMGQLQAEPPGVNYALLQVPPVGQITGHARGLTAALCAKNVAAGYADGCQNVLAKTEIVLLTKKRIPRLFLVQVVDVTVREKRLSNT